jgi:2-isopropylmalate synthase
MTKMPVHKYRPFPAIELPGRQWPSEVIRKAPKWCSVDLRDGNQALAVPMGVKKKKAMFTLLVEMGFEEIEVGFPSASQADFDFLRLLIEEDMIPEQVTVQVLTQSRETLIRRTFEALRGVRKAVVHLYNSTSVLQRRVVFQMDKQEIIQLAVKGAAQIQAEAERMKGSDILYEYTPESFTGTELDFALDICEAVMGVWNPSPEKKTILNLPSTVEMATPNVYADQIEWFCRHIKSRPSVIVSSHAHNDRGTAVAATELALMAGAERVEGTLFGNGERTGNVDIVTLAMNLFSQGIDPDLDLHDIDRIIDVYEKCTGIPVHIRHPYAGELVYTAFSGSHQDAINKGMRVYHEEKPPYWEVPYLPIDPADVGRKYESIIRINSQSGKGGVAYVMEKEFGFRMPKEMQPEFGRIIQSISDRTGREVTPEMIKEAFDREYLGSSGAMAFRSCRIKEYEGIGEPGDVSVSEVTAVIEMNGVQGKIGGKGNGPIDAFTHALRQGTDAAFRLVSYHEHALGEGSGSKAAAYILIEDETAGFSWGVGVDTNIDVASFKAILSALNRAGKMKDEG